MAGRGRWNAGGGSGSGGSGSGNSGFRAAVVLASGAAQTITLSGALDPVSLWVDPAAGDTVQIEVNDASGWNTVGSYTFPQALTLGGCSQVRATRTAGTGTTSQVVASAAAPAPPGATVAVATSRALTAADNGAVLDCTSGITLTVPDTLPGGFACAPMLSGASGGTLSVARSGTALLNGASTTLVMTTSGPAMGLIQATATANAYTVVL